MDKIFDSTVFMRHALDAIPSLVLITDDDMRILYRNRAAKVILKGENIYGNRAGDIMHCIHSTDAAAGCGQGPHCGNCVIRNSVRDAFSGRKVNRRSSEITIRTPKKAMNITALISVSPFNFEDKLCSLLVIEDISELAELRSLLPICASCKKIHAEGDQWEPVEAYMKRNIQGITLSHGLCPSCAKKLYPGHSR